MAVSWERETKINRVNGYWMTSGQGECAMRESDEAGRTAERAIGQGIIREKETGGWLRLWNGTKKAAITVLCLAGAYFFYIVFQLWRYAD